MYIGLILFFTFSITFSFLCSLWEAALLSISPSYTQILKKEKPQLGKTLEKFKNDIDLPLASILTLNTIAHTVGAIGVGQEATKIWSETNPYITSIVVPIIMTLAILILSEIIPKTIGATYWKTFTPFTIRSLRWLIFFLYPILWFIQSFTQFLKKRKKDIVFTRSDMAAMAEIGFSEGQLNNAETNLLKNLLLFQRYKTKDVMTPRTVVHSAEENMTLAEFYEKQEELSFSRILLTSSESPNEYTGYVLKDEVLEYLLEGNKDKVLKSLKRDIIYTSENYSILHLFNDFIKKREHIAVVGDEYGNLIGIVTMEDIIETLLGAEIIDETDKNVDMQEVAKNKWLKNQIAKKNTNT